MDFEHALRKCLLVADEAAGLKWGVASVQGRRPHMEDMYQAEGFGGVGAEGAVALEG